MKVIKVPLEMWDELVKLRRRLMWREFIEEIVADLIVIGAFGLYLWALLSFARKAAVTP